MSELDGNIGYEGKSNFYCPYCYYAGIRPPSYYWHLVDEHPEHVRNGDVLNDVSHKGMALMAVTHLQLIQERERRKEFPPPPMPDEVEAVYARRYGREVRTIPAGFIPASWILAPDKARRSLAEEGYAYVTPADVPSILTKHQQQQEAHTDESHT